MLYNRKADLYHYTRNPDTKISEYVFSKTFDCNMQPLEPKDGFEGGQMLKGLKMYCKIDDIKVGDKIVFSGVSFIVNRFEHRDWLRRRFNKAFIFESEGD